jgi:excinuclease ABC subunit C
MREVMERRALELINLENYPDLLIIDGWKGQLSSVMEIVEKNNLHWLQVVSLAKREEELFIPGKSEPIVLWKTSPELRMIQKIRDESHRFAITFNRDSRIKAMKKNILEWISGIWPKTRKILIREFGNVENLKWISHEELSKFVAKNIIEALDDHWLL